MRLIDADKLNNQAYTCIETTEAFLNLIDEQPTVYTTVLTGDDVRMMIRFFNSEPDDVVAQVFAATSLKEIFTRYNNEEIAKKITDYIKECYMND